MPCLSLSGGLACQSVGIPPPVCILRGCVKDLRHSDDFWRQNEGHHRWRWPTLFRASHTYMYQLSRGSPFADRWRLHPGRCSNRSAVCIHLSHTLNACVHSDIAGFSSTAKLAALGLPLIAAENCCACVSASVLCFGAPPCAPPTCCGLQLCAPNITHYNYCICAVGNPTSFE